MRAAGKPTYEIRKRVPVQVKLPGLKAALHCTNRVFQGRDMGLPLPLVKPQEEETLEK